MTVTRTNPPFSLADAEELDNRLGYPKINVTLSDGTIAQVSIGTLLYNLIVARDILASTDNGKGAAMVGVEDAGGNFSGATVEAVLAELYTAATTGGSDAITDTNNYYATNTIDGALDALGVQIGGTNDAAFGFTEDNVLADNDAVYAALNKLDLKWGDLASNANGEGAALVGIEDSGTLITATTVEGALAENRTAINANQTLTGGTDALRVVQTDGGGSDCPPVDAHVVLRKVA